MFTNPTRFSPALSALFLFCFTPSVFSCAHSTHRKEASDAASVSAPAQESCFNPLGLEIERGLVRYLEASAKAQREGGPAEVKRPDRSAFYRISIPHSEEEVRKTNSMGIMAFTLLSHQKKDFPLGQVLLKEIVPDSPGASRTKGTDPLWVDLPRMLPGELVEVIPENSQTYRWLGSWIQTVYFWIPLRFLAEKGAVTGDDLVPRDFDVVARPRGRLNSITAGGLLRGEELGRLSPEQKKWLSLRENDAVLPDVSVGFQMLRRDFCFGAALQLP